MMVATAQLHPLCCRQRSAPIAQHRKRPRPQRRSTLGCETSQKGRTACGRLGTERVLCEAAACTYQSADANNHLPRKPAFFPLAYFARGYWRSWQIGDSNRKREESSAFARSPRSANIHFLERAIRMRAAQILGAIVVAASMVALLSDRGAEAQSDTDLNVLRGLAPLSTRSIKRMRARPC